MVRPTSAGTWAAVSRDASTITANAIGTVQAAGCDISAPVQPCRLGPRTVTSTDAAANPPPTSRPAPAPVAVSPRHQVPSTSSGQNDDAATANASPTTWETSSSAV